MKRFFFLSLFAIAFMAVSAQKKVGTLSVMPKVGLCLANISNSNISYDLTGDNANVAAKYRAGFTGGAELEYQFQLQCSFSIGALYALQGCRYKDFSNEVSGQAGSYSGCSNMAMGLHYLQVPVLVNVYLTKGLAIKAGIQPAFLLGAKAKYDVTDFVVGADGGAVYETPRHVRTNIKGNFRSTDLSMPIGISYEYSNVIMEARYHLSLTKVEKHINSKNRWFTFSVGYRLNLL